jgi:hypothetical protein
MMNRETPSISTAPIAAVDSASVYAGTPTSAGLRSNSATACVMAPVLGVPALEGELAEAR